MYIISNNDLTWFIKYLIYKSLTKFLLDPINITKSLN